MFDSNKVSWNQIKICSNQISAVNQTNYIFDHILMHQFPWFEEKFIWFKQIFNWPKDILIELNKCYLIKINLLFE